MYQPPPPPPPPPRFSACNIEKLGMGLGTRLAYLLIQAGTKVVRTNTLAKGALNSFELQGTHTLLRLSQLEKELAHNPDKALTWLLILLQDRVDNGHNGLIGLIGLGKAKILPMIHLSTLSPHFVSYMAEKTH